MSGPLGFDATVPNAARMYDYWLGGKNNFAADREAAEQIVKITHGWIRHDARLNRAFLGRAVRTAVAAGVRQFLDLGSGLPTEKNVHEVARRIDPAARVVYVDYDPVVAAHGQALLAGADGVGFVQADIRKPDDILEHPVTEQLIDFDEPVGLLAVAVLHFVSDDEDPYGILERFRPRLVPGSHLAISHLEKDSYPKIIDRAHEIYKRVSTGFTVRDRAELTRMFEGFELLEPGLTHPAKWRPDDEIETAETFARLVGVGVKR
ncbi:SAM-dependent methyltransferase [Spirillospora sp. NPDC047279]|uniref:SAM-dependent methyltransferase n=1 Tax=Spirillospora sp. NPDC047279 TaxID=3155478 RepID=UPI0033F8EF3A